MELPKPRAMALELRKPRAMALAQRNHRAITLELPKVRTTARLTTVTLNLSLSFVSRRRLAMNRLRPVSNRWLSAIFEKKGCALFIAASSSPRQEAHCSVGGLPRTPLHIVRSFFLQRRRLHVRKLIAALGYFAVLHFILTDPADNSSRCGISVGAQGAVKRK